jgi:AraC-like DNA-binding protein
LVYNLGSLTHDFAFLLPFYSQLEDQPHVLRCDETHAVEASEKLEELVREFFQPKGTLYREAACKATLLSLLMVLLRRFQDAAVMQWQFERRRQMAHRFSRLLEHLRNPSAERLSLGQSARMCGMSLAKFTRCFKQVAGTSYLVYVTRLRLTEAARLLRAGGRSIGEIADQMGFADQSHFDRRFKRAFGLTPSQYQRQHRKTLKTD